MSPTPSPTCPEHSPTPVHDEEESELQAFLAAAKREAQEKWEKLQAARTWEVVEKEADDSIYIKWEVVPKVESKPQKVITKMVAEMPRTRGMIPVGFSSNTLGVQ
ncbi:hypothetical protein GGU10DRAFT_380567 [Lentinula aff. detonsa]|uniref:Uncharacterized protein n=1 Tax=Lentinula aff. detonsa TaxID=2804958 RepID=A0AA38KDA7_9AGAR|nr:hypothetical protein GGU10DRAFT_380567 [Lentinula aff. detonsa]